MASPKPVRSTRLHGGEWLLSFICAGLVVVYFCSLLGTGLELERRQHAGELSRQVHAISGQFQHIEQLIEELAKPARTTNRLADKRLQQKKIVIDQLRILEEQGNQLTLMYQDYKNDFSLQDTSPFHAASSSKLHAQFTKSLGLKVAIDRYIRSVEHSLSQTAMTKEQSALAREPYWALKWHLDNFEK